MNLSFMLLFNLINSDKNQKKVLAKMATIDVLANHERLCNGHVTWYNVLLSEDVAEFVLL